MHPRLLKYLVSKDVCIYNFAELAKELRYAADHYDLGYGICTIVRQVVFCAHKRSGKYYYTLAFSLCDYANARFGEYGFTHISMSTWSNMSNVEQNAARKYALLKLIMDIEYEP